MAKSARVWLTRLAIFGVLLAFCVVMLGAWTRLSDAGLGCPDWPTCYGSITVPLSEAAIARAHELYPGQPFVAAKAWPEMIHRHFAKAIGLVCLALMLIALKGRSRDPALPVKHAVFLFFLVCLQGAFGAWTVTMKLFPPVVTGHLLLGFTTLTALFLLALRSGRAFAATHTAAAAALLPLALVAIAVLAVQIALGGWTASNYAATVCTGLPVCQSGWQGVLNFPDAFAIHTYAGTTYEFAPHLDPAAKVTIHVAHRIGAMVTTATLLVFVVSLWRLGVSRYRRLALAVMAVLAAQVALGVSNIVFHLPLAVAVAHNVVALVLMQLLVAAAFSLYRERAA